MYLKENEEIMDKFRATIIYFSSELGIDINKIFVFDGVSLKIVAVT